jgi:hypothetical protein
MWEAALQGQLAWEGTLQIHLSLRFMSSEFELSFDGDFTNPSLIAIHEQ